MRINLIKLLLPAMICSYMSVNAQSYKESQKVVFTPENGAKVYQLNPDKSVSFDVAFENVSYPTRKQIRVVGGVKMPEPYSSRGEEMFRRSEFLIDDNLDSQNVDKERYSLYFKGNDDNYERHAYYRIDGSLLKEGNAQLTINTKTNELNVNQGGDFGIKVELFYSKAGRHKDDIYDTPDSIIYMPIENGSKKFEVLKHDFNLPKNVACLFLTIGGTNFSGECHVEAPKIAQNGKVAWNAPFVKYADRDNDYNYWIGCNLSTRSMPRWRLDYNGKSVFEGNIFDRASDIADFYIPIPNEIKKDGKFTLTLLSEPNRAAFPFDITRIELIQESSRDLEVVAVPRYVQNKSQFGVLIEINKPNMKLAISSDSKALKPIQSEISFKETGLYVVKFKAEDCATDAKAKIGDIEIVIPHIITKSTDAYLSSGDEIHIDKVYNSYDYFFKWYVSQRIGNWYQFRPSYQWSGVRITDPNVIKHYTSLLNDLQIPYAWQAEGRTLAGKRINPTVAQLESPMFRGKQAHENDGGYYYWQHFLYKGVFSDMAARNRPYGGIFAKHRPIYTDHGVFIHYDPYGVTDMADGATKLVENLKYSKGESTRHTGPSTLFRYFYQAGYDWLGAEQMYGPEEIIMSSLRGASRAYGKTNYGSLHAMQWGSFPFTDPKHAMRLYMSLTVAYMHGSSHINTEEALWTDEYANDRYTESGKLHIDAQHRVLDYIETHSRKGELTSNIAVIQGRNDAWKSFGRKSLWSQAGEKWEFNNAAKSFDLLNIFYPENIVNSCGPEGWFTSTPYGTVDILPIEASSDVMNSYKLMVFLGWNSYQDDDFKRIESFVTNGGTLILSAAHLNSELQPNAPAKFPTDDTQIKKLLGENYKSLTSKTELKRGKGKIIYFPQNIYPIESQLVDQYTETVKAESAATVKNESERGWIASSPKIGFTVWDSANHRTLYLLNTDWQSNNTSHAAQFVLANKTFNVDVRQNQMETIFCAKNAAVMPQKNTTDVIEIKQDKNRTAFIIQTTGSDTITIFNAKDGSVKTQEISSPGSHTIVI